MHFFFFLQVLARNLFASVKSASHAVPRNKPRRLASAPLVLPATYCQRENLIGNTAPMATFCQREKIIGNNAPTVSCDTDKTPTTPVTETLHCFTHSGCAEGVVNACLTMPENIKGSSEIGQAENNKNGNSVYVNAEDINTNTSMLASSKAMHDSPTKEFILTDEGVEKKMKSPTLPTRSPQSSMRLKFSTSTPLLGANLRSKLHKTSLRKYSTFIPSDERCKPECCHHKSGASNFLYNKSASTCAGVIYSTRKIPVIEQVEPTSSQLINERNMNSVNIPFDALPMKSVAEDIGVDIVRRTSRGVLRKHTSENLSAFIELTKAEESVPKVTDDIRLLPMDGVDSTSSLLEPQKLVFDNSEEMSEFNVGIVRSSEQIMKTDIECTSSTNLNVDHEILSHGEVSTKCANSVEKLCLNQKWNQKWNNRKIDTLTKNGIIEKYPDRNSDPSLKCLTDVSISVNSNKTSSFIIAKPNISKLSPSGLKKLELLLQKKPAKTFFYPSANEEANYRTESLSFTDSIQNKMEFSGFSDIDTSTFLPSKNREKTPVIDNVGNSCTSVNISVPSNSFSLLGNHYSDLSVLAGDISNNAKPQNNVPLRNVPENISLSDPCPPLNCISPSSYNIDDIILRVSQQCTRHKSESVRNGSTLVHDHDLVPAQDSVITTDQCKSKIVLSTSNISSSVDNRTVQHSSGHNCNSPSPVDNNAMSCVTSDKRENNTISESDADFVQLQSCVPNKEDYNVTKASSAETSSIRQCDKVGQKWTEADVHAWQDDPMSMEMEEYFLNVSTQTLVDGTKYEVALDHEHSQEGLNSGVKCPSSIIDTDDMKHSIENFTKTNLLRETPTSQNKRKLVDEFTVESTVNISKRSYTDTLHCKALLSKTNSTPVIDGNYHSDSLKQCRSSLGITNNFPTDSQSNSTDPNDISKCQLLNGAPGKENMQLPVNFIDSSSVSPCNKPVETIASIDASSSIVFTTARGRRTQVNSEALGKVKKLWNDSQTASNDSAASFSSTNKHVSSSPSSSVDQKENCHCEKTPLHCEGFTTAAGIPLKSSDEAVKNALCMWNESGESTAFCTVNKECPSNLILGPRTKLSNAVCDYSAYDLKNDPSHVKASFESKPEAVIGFSTANGKVIIINNEGLKRARMLWKESSTDITIEPFNIISKRNLTSFTNCDKSAISAEAMSRAKTIWNEISSDKLMDNLENKSKTLFEPAAAGSSSAINDRSQTEASNVESESGFSGFMTCRGNLVAVSDDAMRRAQSLWTDTTFDDIGKPSTQLPTAFSVINAHRSSSVNIDPEVLADTRNVNSPTADGSGKFKTPMRKRPSSLNGPLRSCFSSHQPAPKRKGFIKHNVDVSRITGKSSHRPEPLPNPSGISCAHITTRKYPANAGGSREMSYNSLLNDCNSSATNSMLSQLTEDEMIMLDAQFSDIAQQFLADDDWDFDAEKNDNSLVDSSNMSTTAINANVSCVESSSSVMDSKLSFTVQVTSSVVFCNQIEKLFVNDD